MPNTKPMADLPIGTNLDQPIPRGARWVGGAVGPRRYAEDWYRGPASWQNLPQISMLMAVQNKRNLVARDDRGKGGRIAQATDAICRSAAGRRMM